MIDERLGHALEKHDRRVAVLWAAVVAVGTFYLLNVMPKAARPFQEPYLALSMVGAGAVLYLACRPVLRGFLRTLMPPVLSGSSGKVRAVRGLVMVKQPGFWRGMGWLETIAHIEAGLAVAVWGLKSSPFIAMLLFSIGILFAAAPFRKHKRIRATIERFEMRRAVERLLGGVWFQVAALLALVAAVVYSASLEDSSGSVASYLWLSVAAFLAFVFTHLLLALHLDPVRRVLDQIAFRLMLGEITEEAAEKAWIAAELLREEEDHSFPDLDAILACLYPSGSTEPGVAPAQSLHPTTF